MEHCPTCGCKSCRCPLPPTIIIPKPQHVIEIPRLEHFQFGHGRGLVKRRAKILDKVRQQLHQVENWLKREKKYLEDNCVGHIYPSDPRDPGGGGGYCKDCGKANPKC